MVLLIISRCIACFTRQIISILLRSGLRNFGRPKLLDSVDVRELAEISRLEGEPLTLAATNALHSMDTCLKLCLLEPVAFSAKWALRGSPVALAACPYIQRGDVSQRGGY